MAAASGGGHSSRDSGGVTCQIRSFNPWRVKIISTDRHLVYLPRDHGIEKQEWTSDGWEACFRDLGGSERGPGHGGRPETQFRSRTSRSCQWALVGVREGKE